VALLPGDPAGAAAGFEPLVELFRASDGTGIVSALQDLLSPRDSELLRDPRIAAGFIETEREGLRPGTSGAGWDNVSWVGEWDIDLGAVTCPVLLWYGSEDRMAPPAHGLWLSQNLARARLVLRDGPCKSDSSRPAAGAESSPAIMRFTSSLDSDTRSSLASSGVSCTMAVYCDPSA